jgi:hypothetical protein
VNDGACPDRLSLLGRPLPPAFELLVVTLAPGRERPFEAAEWRDALVVVERGEVELESLRGTRARFAHGAVLCLTGLPLRALRNRAADTAVLTVVRRGGRPVRPGARRGAPRPGSGGAAGAG